MLSILMKVYLILYNICDYFSFISLKLNLIYLSFNFKRVVESSKKI